VREKACRLLVKVDHVVMVARGTYHVAVTIRLRLFSVLLVGLAVAVLPARSGLAAGGESISSYDTRLEVRPDGRLRVTETIRYDFGGNRRHGILRRIPARFRYDDTHDRIYPLSEVSISRDDHLEPVDHYSDSGYEQFKIGNPDREITGAHTYVIAYTVSGALNDFPEHEELYWNAVGDEWNVPIGAATTTVTGPAAISRTACFAGPSDSHLSCGSAVASGSTATFHHGALAPGSGLTIVVALPKGSVTSVAPILTQRRDLATTFRATPATVGGALGLALLGIGVAVGVGWRVGRDRRYIGLLPGLVPEHGERAAEERKPVIGKPPVSVEFVPPERIRPGQVGTLIDERANVLDVTATIIDFAVRRHLLIRELPRAKKPDWELVKLTSGDPAFLPYERKLFRALFADRDKVRLSQLRATFATDLGKVRRQLYTDMVTQGWYRASPARTRAAARRIAVLVLFASLVATGLLAALVHLGLLGLGLIAGAVALLVAAGNFPARTGRGSAMLERVQGFRLYVATAEAEQIKFFEREKIFSEYLPYAIVFGLADRWAKTFAGIANTAPDGLPRSTPGLYWYAGTTEFNLDHFDGSLGNLTTMTTGAIAAATASAAGSSGLGGGFGGTGYVGGGAGGGGGGSW
jgi:uncharacterized membrane protein YgcG